MSEARLDQLIAALAGTAPALDDLTRARIAANLETAPAAAAPRPPASHPRWWIGGAAVVAAAGALALGLTWRGGATGPARRVEASTAAPAVIARPLASCDAESAVSPEQPTAPPRVAGATPPAHPPGAPAATATPPTRPRASRAAARPRVASAAVVAPAPHAAPEPAQHPPADDDPAAAAATPEPAPPDIAARYATAERLMTTDPAAARAALNALVIEAPRAPEAAEAMLDIAQLATRAGDLHAARAALDQLPALPGGPALARPAAYLRCVLEQDPMPLAGCLMSFRAAYPQSPNDAEVLARLATVVANTDCQAARPLLSEYHQRYPTGPSAATLQTWSATCARNTH